MLCEEGMRFYLAYSEIDQISYTPCKKFKTKAKKITYRRECPEKQLAWNLNFYTSINNSSVL